MISKILGLLFFSYLCCSAVANAKDNPTAIWITFKVHQIDSNHISLLIDLPHNMVQTLTLSTRHTQNTPIIVNQQTIGSCQLSRPVVDSLRLNIYLMPDAPVYADLLVKSLPYCPLKLQLSASSKSYVIAPNNPVGLLLKTNIATTPLSKVYVTMSSISDNDAVGIYQDPNTKLKGLADKAGNVIHQAIYDDVLVLSKHCLFIHNNKVAITDKDGQLLSSWQYKNVGTLDKNTLLLTLMNDSIAVANIKGEVFPAFSANAPTYYYQLSPQKFIVCTQQGMGLIDEKGKVLVPFDYTSVQLCGNHCVVVQKNNLLYGLIDLNSGKEILPVQYDSIQSSTAYPIVNDSIFIVQYQHLWGLVRCDNSFLLAPRYQYPIISNGKYWYSTNNIDRTFVIDSLGHEILSLPYAILNEGFTPPRTRIMFNNKYGLIDADGKEIIPCIADIPLLFYYTNEQGKRTPSPVSLIIQNRKSGIIDTNGYFRVPAIYDNILPKSHISTFAPINYAADYYAVTMNQKAGIIDSKGKVSIPIEYDAVSFACNNLVRLYKDRDRKCGWATTAGKIYIQPSLPTQTCTYKENKVLTYPISLPCYYTEPPCDEVVLPCFQCEKECPDETWLQQLLEDK